MDAYTLAVIALIAALILRELWYSFIDAYVCNVAQARYDAATAEMKLDDICSEFCALDNLTELPYMKTADRSKLWRVLDDFELRAQLILGAAAVKHLPEICKEDAHKL